MGFELINFSGMILVLIEICTGAIQKICHLGKGGEVFVKKLTKGDTGGTGCSQRIDNAF